MSLLDIALKNVVRDWRTYAMHFANCLFSVTVFFLFCSLALHPGMNELSMASTLGLLTMLAAGIVAAFSIGFVTYSQGCFLKTRSKQFAIMELMGMSARQRRNLVFAEGALIGGAALAGGLALGFVTLNLFLAAASKAVGSQFGFYPPFAAAGVTVAVFVPLFVLASLLGLKALGNKRIVELFSSDEQDEKKPRLIFSGAATALFATIAAFALPIATRETGIAANLAVLGCSAAALICATFFVMQGCLSLKERLSRASGRYYRGTHMIRSSLFNSNARSNLQSMTLSAVLYAAALLAVAVLVAISGNVAQTTRSLVPYALTYTAWSQDVPVQEHVDEIREAVHGKPGLREIDFALSWADKEMRLATMPESEFNRVASFLGSKTVALEPGEALSVANGIDASRCDIPDSLQSAAQEHGVKLSCSKTDETRLMTAGFFESLFVVSDEDFDACFAGDEQQRIYAWNYDSWTDTSVTASLEGIAPYLERVDISMAEANFYYTSEKTQYSVMLYLASFVSIVFILAIASFTYSRLHARAAVEAERFAAIAKLGLSRKELARICLSHAATLLLAPFALALAYLWIGVVVIQGSITQPLIAVAGAETLVACVAEGVAYVLVSRSYVREIAHKVFPAETK